MNRKILLLFLLPLITVVLFSSCRKWRCIEGDGYMSSENRYPGGFKGVIAKIDCEVFVVQDTVTYVIVKADQELMPYIETAIEGRNFNLIIDKNTKRCMRSKQPIYVEVHSPEIYSVELAGGGKITCDYISQDRLRFVLNGSGNIDFYGIDAGNIIAEVPGSGQIRLAGRNGQGIFEIIGSGQIHSIDLLQDNCNATVSGSGDILVQVTDVLDAEISGSGNVVFYNVTPLKIYRKITGSGKVISSWTN